MKIANCCIAKMENAYMREYVEYYKSIGVDNIIIYDNNEVDGEKFSDVIGDYIESGYVIIEDIRGIKNMNFILSVYQHCYDKYSSLYDWILYMDTDEFFTINDNSSSNMHDFLSKDIFKDYGMIHPNWRLYDDNEMLTNDGRGCLERFTHASEGEYAIDNKHIKTFVRGGLNGLKWVYTPHTPIVETKTCDCEGNEINGASPFSTPNFNGGYIKHFALKTIEEYCNIKMKRLCCDRDNLSAENALTLNFFFERNTWSQEKVDLAKKIMGINYKIVAVIPSGRKRFMKLLLPYVLQSYIVDEIHLWVNTTDKKDLAFIKQVSEQFDKVKLIERPLTEKKIVKNINQFYDYCNDENTIYIKLDDDVVFMENNAIEKMVNYRIGNPEYFLVSPLVINNNMGCMMLYKNKKITATNTPIAALKYMDNFSANAESIHSLLLRTFNQTRGDLRALYCEDDKQYCNDFSINFVLWFGKDMTDDAINDLKTLDNDELVLSLDIPFKKNKANGFCGKAIASHFAFGKQLKDMSKTNILQMYEAISKFNCENRIQYTKLHNTINAIYNDNK